MAMGGIQNNMTKTLNPPLRAIENLLNPLMCKMKKFDPPKSNVKSLTYAIEEFFTPLKRNVKILNPPQAGLQIFLTPSPLYPLLLD